MGAKCTTAVLEINELVELGARKANDLNAYTNKLAEFVEHLDEFGKKDKRSILKLVSDILHEINNGVELPSTPSTVIDLREE